MHKAEKFINWIEGVLDASKNKLSSAQIREIRKKIKEYHEQSSENEKGDHFMGSNNTISPKFALNEDFLKEIEKNKAASTMEELI